jgi:hypothetical protein
VSDRQPISKRTRFEVFKRDDFACQYCGATPPKVVLEVDHIDPVCEGGSSDADNLITACFSCNRGKAGVPLSVVPQALADKAAEVAEREEQLAGYQAILRAKRERLEDDVWAVFAHWRGQDETTHERFNSAKRFVERLGLHEVLDSVDIAMGANIRSQKREFLYFCKVCWNKISRLEAGE